MLAKARVLTIALDACDARLVRELAGAGRMPAVAGLLEQGAAIELEAPVGVFVSANWPTIFTATRPDRHGYLCGNEYAGGSYERRETDPTRVQGTPFWETLSEAGRRVAVLDVPHTVTRPLDGVMLTEWGCHDRHFGTTSWPSGLAEELSARHGAHPVGTAPKPGADRDQFAPCDYVHRDGPLRTDEEFASLYHDLCAAIDVKTSASLELLDRGGWDLFLTVYGEGHCVGHQLWHLHDPGHPFHDAALAARLDGDPVAAIYERLDAAVAAHLERVGPDETVFLLLPHGMAAHHDGTHLLDEVLHRLDWGLDHGGELGGVTRLAAGVTRPLPAALRRPALRSLAPLVRRRPAAPFADRLPHVADRRWFAALNNTVVGGVRLNLAGREPDGRIHPDDRGEVLAWLSARLRELVNVDTGGPVVTSCVVTDDVYRRGPGDAFADLYVEWEHSVPIERVWSPAAGTVMVPYDHWRQGDHVREGLLLARGPGVRPGPRRGRAAVVDVAPTVAAALGADLGEVDGRPLTALLPEGAERRPSPRRPATRRTRSAPAWARRQDPALVRLRREQAASAAAQGAAVAGLTARIDAVDKLLENKLTDLTDRLTAAERTNAIHTMTAWLREEEARSDLLVSVVMPTRNRVDRLPRAIASVEAQTHQRWELLIVDDGSTDGTQEYLATLEDPRIRVFDREHAGAGAARNVALDVATGDAITYLDDDNRYDPDWLKAVALTFESHPDAALCYGARIIDDLGRAHGGVSTGSPAVHYLPWDPAAIREHNRTDMNVLAHRPCTTRFDEDLLMFADWDLLLRLLTDVDPVEVPAIAAYYSTTDPERLSARLTSDEIGREYDRVRAKLLGAAGPG